MRIKTKVVSHLKHDAQRRRQFFATMDRTQQPPVKEKDIKRQTFYLFITEFSQKKTYLSCLCSFPPLELNVIVYSLLID